MDIPLYTRTLDDSDDSAIRRLIEETYGFIYWANTILGQVRPHLFPESQQRRVLWLQQRLFRASHDLNHGSVGITEEDVHRLQSWRECDALGLPPLSHFIIPGGLPDAGRLLEAAAVLMQARRWLARLSRVAPINTRVAQLLDESSHWLFIAARRHNHAEHYEEIPVDLRP